MRQDVQPEPPEPRTNFRLINYSLYAEKLRTAEAARSFVIPRDRISVLIRLEDCVEHYGSALGAVLHGAELLLAVGEAVLALNEHHRCGYHVSAELSVVTRSGYTDA